ncbi:membrane trafficking regulatory protein [Lithospermum erythrorhizon]|uniref:Membrane trafficking regulatory protein n=1 Tax=Lithospermum erythrorhizon TaxID=34254 RepID=A0AAV3NZN5_LITER
MQGSTRLLTVEPHEIKFPYEVGKEASCSVRLSNNTTKKVAFKVQTSDPSKYFGKPTVGLILPRQTCEVIVKMVAPRVFPTAEMKCEDTFVIQSLVPRPRANSNDITSNMFREAEPYVEEHELRVAYLIPSEAYQMEDYFNSYIREELLGRGSNIGRWVVYGLLALVFFALIQKTISVIWSLLIVLVVKAVLKVVSDSVEDWIVKAFVQVIVHFVRFIFDYVE